MLQSAALHERTSGWDRGEGKSDYPRDGDGKSDLATVFEKEHEESTSWDSRWWDRNRGVRVSGLGLMSGRR